MELIQMIWFDLLSTV